MLFKNKTLRIYRSFLKLKRINKLEVIPNIRFRIEKFTTGVFKKKFGFSFDWSKKKILVKKFILKLLFKEKIYQKV